MTFHKSFLLVFAVVLAALPAAAQIDTGAIVGTVTDSSGSVVPNAQVTATNIGTNQSVSTQTNSQGQYVFTGLKIGAYSVTAELTGFRKTVQSGVDLHVQDRLAVNLVLQVGAVAETVEVSTAPPLLNTQSADMGAVIDKREVTDLPINGRRYADLALLAPGVLPRPGTGNPSEARFNVNGNFSLHNYFALDGASNNNAGGLMGGSPQIISANPDALAEFKVQTRSYTVEYGDSAGAVINATIKSGSNRFHGSLYEFMRNSALNANDFFANRNGIKKGNLVQNQGGFTLGGPVVIPKLYNGRDRTFFFSDFQLQRRRAAATLTGTAPTAAMKRGDFTGFPAMAATLPSQAGCIVNNVIQASCIDPVGQKYAQQFPDPTVAGAFTGGNYIANASVPNDFEQYDIKVDQKITNRDNAFVRFSYLDPRDLREAGAFTATNPLSTGGFTANAEAVSRQAVTGWTHLFGSNMVNESRFAFGRKNAQVSPYVPYGSQADKVLGLKNVPNSPLASGIPAMNVSGFSKLGTAEWRPQFEVSQVWQAFDNLSWVKGTHSYKFGMDFKRYSFNKLDLRATQGAMDVNNKFVSGSNTSAGALASLLLGNVTTFYLTSPFVMHNYLNGLSGYAQDTWRVTPKFTLTYGLRYEFFTPWIERDNHTSNFNANGGGSIVTASSGGIYERALIRPDFNNFAPRLGFSWNAYQKWTVRGGFGAYYQAYDRIGSESLIQIAPPHVLDRAFTPATTPAFFLKDGYPTLPAADLTSLAFRQSIQMRAQAQDQRTPYVEQLSLGVEHQFANNFVMELAGVGNYAHKVRKLRNLNQGSFTNPGSPGVVFPYGAGWGNGFIQYLATDGNTNYHGLQFRVDKRYSSGFQVTANYTYGKVLGNVGDNLSGGFSGGQITPKDVRNLRGDYGPLVFDQRQRLVVNYIYDLPFGKGKRWLNNSGAANYIFGNWQINGISAFTSGAALTATQGGANASSSDTSPNGGASSRANCVAPVSTGGNIDAWFNTSAFAAAPRYTFGTCGVGIFYGPGIANWDFSVFKKFPITEGSRLEFHTEFYNMWNHPQFTPPNTTITSAAFGKITSLQVPVREIQFALKYIF